MNAAYATIFLVFVLSSAAAAPNKSHSLEPLVADALSHRFAAACENPQNPDCQLSADPIPYPIYLLSPNETDPVDPLLAVEIPVIGLGKVLYQSQDKRKSVDLTQVDLDRTKRAWTDISDFNYLDTHPLQGTPNSILPHLANALVDRLDEGSHSQL